MRVFAAGALVATIAVSVVSVSSRGYGAGSPAPLRIVWTSDPLTDARSVDATGPNSIIEDRGRLFVRLACRSPLPSVIAALDPKNGDVLWKWKMAGDAPGGPQAVAADEWRVYVLSEADGIAALSRSVPPELGHPRIYWRIRRPGNGRGVISVFDHKLSPPRSRELLVVRGESTVFALWRSTAKMCWELSRVRYINPVSVSRRGNMLFCVGQWDVLEWNRGVLFAIDMGRGEVVWQHGAEDRDIVACCLGGEVVYAVKADGGILCLDAESGEPAKSYGVRFSRTVLSCRAFGKVLLAVEGRGRGDPTLEAVDLSQGKRLWSKTFPRTGHLRVAFSEGGAYLATDTELIAVAAADGGETKLDLTKIGCPLPMLVCHGNRCYLATDRGTIVCVAAQ